jgi:hypothetical protein
MFPSNPNINDLHTEQGKDFIYNGEGWVLQIDIDLLPANKSNVDLAIGASSNGDAELLYNQKGEWVAGGSGGGTTNYNNLSNKPRINNVELSGNKTSGDLGLATSAQGAKADSALQSFTETDPLSLHTTAKITTVNVESAVDLKHAAGSDNQVASDFDIKDLTDSTSLRSTWSGKQNSLGFTPENSSNKQNSLTVDGTGAKFPTVDAVNSELSLIVPYTGAANDVDLGTHAQKASKFQFKTDAVNTLTTGELGWNAHDRTVDMKVDGATIQLNQEQNLTVKNTTGSTLLNGRLVRIIGYDDTNDYYLISYSDCSSESTAYVDFMLTEDIVNGAIGTAIKAGILHDLNTSSGTQSNPVYLSTSGQYSASAPAYPNKTVVVGTFGKIDAITGEILVDLNKTTQHTTNQLSNRIDLKMMTNPGIDASTPILPTDIVIDTTALTLTIATINNGQIITAANPIRFFTDGSGIINKWEKSSPVVFNFTNSTGVWYFYFNNSGTPIATQAPWSEFNTIATVYRFYWNATLSGASRLVVENNESHLNDISASDHGWKHSQGSVYENGLDIVSNTLSIGTPDVDGRNTVLSLTSGKCSDDGLDWTVVNTQIPVNYFEQDLGNNTSSLLTSSNSGRFRIRTNDINGLLNFLPATRFPFLWDVSTNRPQYLSQTGVPTLIAGSNFFVYYLYNFNDRVPGSTIKLVSAPQEFATLALAQSHNWESLRAIYASIKDNEIRPLYKVIFEYRATFSVLVKYSVIRQIDDIRTQRTTTSIASAGSTLASNVVFTPSGNIASTNVQSALVELDTEKIDKLLLINGINHTSNINLVESLGYAMSDATTDITSGVKVPCAAVPYNFTITGVRAQVGTAAVGALLLTIEVKKNGTSIFSTRLTIDSTETISETAATQYTFAGGVTSIAVLTSDVIELSVYQAGGVTTAAKNLTLFLIGYKTV